jgi:hypothetical protein
MSAAQHSQLALDLDIHPLAGRIGAEIGNVRLGGDLPKPTRRHWQRQTATTCGRRDCLRRVSN